ncbi:unnamed protein product [Clonostachys rhizophaga]|uniref:Small ribosomal subunit protein uS10m n=1 Tax=Clonostachys rhizophaga TaxID=160324 RepID=A0A9N9YIQ1_9HYPO|nr:unnamed protein product [Clonostachys rhizophaga]
MDDEFVGQIDQLLLEAEQRLQPDKPTSALATSVLTRPTKLETPAVSSKEPVSKTSLAVRDASKPILPTQKGDSAGANWFDMPKTDLTTEMKRDWQILRMRNILDPKHQRKNLQSEPPKYSQVGEIIAGPTDYYSARLTRKERKRNLLEEAMSTRDDVKMKTKYAGIQKNKTSGKRAFYQNLVVKPWIVQRTQATLATPNEKLPNSIAPQEDESEPSARYPRSIQALHLKPLKREAEYGIPSCDLQLRSFSLQPLVFFTDFALRAAYYLGLPASGPVPLPRITQRWTVPRSHFIFKKSQENFERITLRRLIQIKDGNPETVQLWLAYLRKHQYYGVGMKANMWEFGEPGEGKAMDETLEKEVEKLDEAWSHMGQTQAIGNATKVEELLSSRKLKQAAGLREPPTTGTS